MSGLDDNTLTDFPDISKCRVKNRASAAKVAAGRRELMSEHFDLPSRYWEPEPDEEDLERMEREYAEKHADDDDEELPFM